MTSICGGELGSARLRPNLVLKTAAPDLIATWRVDWPSFFLGGALSRRGDQAWVGIEA